MLRCILQVAESAILILRGIHWDALKTPPADAKHERVIALENFLVPTMLLEPAADQSTFRLLRSQAPDD